MVCFAARPGAQTESGICEGCAAVQELDGKQIGYLKLDFLPITMTWFDQERIEFDPERVHA
jgi:hypothetical protein